MRLPLEQAGTSLGLDEWLKGAGAPLAIAAHPAGKLVALARGQVLAVLPLLPDKPEQQSPDSSQQQHDPAAQCYLHSSKHEYTALAWFGQLQSPRPGSAQRRQQQEHSSQAKSAADGYQSVLESEVLLSGTADGYLQIHSATGQLLYKQRLFGTAVMDIHVRPHCSGLSSADPGEEVAVCFSNALVRINCLDLRAQIRMLQLIQSGSTSVAVGASPLAYVRYDLPAAVGPRSSGLSFGPLPSELYSLLSSGASGYSLGSMAGFNSRQGRPKHKVCIVTVGRGPCLAAFEAEEHPSRSTLATLVGLASSLSSNVMGAASQVAGLAPSVIAYGMKTLTRPLSSWYGGGSSSRTSNAQPVVSFDDLQALPKPEPLTLTKQLRDDERVLEALVPAPLGPLLVAPDNLGRVLLVDGADMVAVRIWKGYRDAQCGWLLPPASHPAAALGLLLVLYAPKRQVLEVWVPRSGQRLVGVPVEYPCLLVSVGLPCGGWGNATAWEAWLQQCGSATTLVVNMETGATWDALSCLEEE